MRPRTTVASAVVFLLLATASVGAFFITTRLKRSTPVVQQLSFSRYLSPNEDAVKDRTRISFLTKRRDEVTVTIVDEDGDEARVLARDRELPRGRHRFTWNGARGNGVVVGDGEYRVRVGLRRQGRSITSPRKLFVDTTPPRPIVRYVSPDSISPDGAGTGSRARLRFDGAARVAPRLLVYRTDAATPVLVARRTGMRGSNELSWDGLIDDRDRDRPAPPGNYVMVVRTRDAAGNVGPVPLPPRRGSLGGHPGLVVSYLSARGPSGPVRAGETARFAVSADGRRYRWSVRRLGSRRTLQRGSGQSSTLRVRAPRGPSGVFLLGLRVGSRRYETPFAVQAVRRRPVLVVLPATSWQARNPSDANGDGFADTLPEADEVRLRRPYARGGLPPGFSVREAPLLLFLDHERLRFDITDDLSLTGTRARPPVRYSGILFAGPPRFFSRSVGRLVRSYVEAGGRVGWIGTAGFTGAVSANRTLLSAPRVSERANLFGERLAADNPAGPLSVLGDTISFFRGTGGSFGPFPALEEGERIPRRAVLLASAGREAGKPSIAVYRYGKGVVVRIGADGFALAAGTSPDAARIMRRLWTLLSR